MLTAIATRRIRSDAPTRRRANRTASRGGELGAPLTHSQIAGGLSLIDHLPLSIAAVPGLVVRVRSGAIWVTRPGEAKDRVVRAGERLVVDRAGALVVCALGTSELQIEWPLRGLARLSPGLEPLDGVA